MRGAISNRTPPAAGYSPVGGERFVHLVAWGVLKNEESVTTQQLGSSRATKWRGSVSWREVSTGGADLHHHQGDAEIATPSTLVMPVVPLRVVPNKCNENTSRERLKSRPIRPVLSRCVYHPRCTHKTLDIYSYQP